MQTKIAGIGSVIRINKARRCIRLQSAKA